MARSLKSATRWLLAGIIWTAVSGGVAVSYKYILAMPPKPDDKPGQKVVQVPPPKPEPGTTRPVAVVPPEPGPTTKPVVVAPPEPGPTTKPVVVAPPEPGPATKPVVVAPPEPGPTTKPVVVAPPEPGPTRTSTQVAIVPKATEPAPPPAIKWEFVQHPDATTEVKLTRQNAVSSFGGTDNIERVAKALRDNPDYFVMLTARMTSDEGKDVAAIRIDGVRKGLIGVGIAESRILTAQPANSDADPSGIYKVTCALVQKAR
jgi:hypothetical protein